MREIGPGPPSHSARWKNTQGPTDMTSISSTSQRKRRGGGGSTEGDRNNCLLGLPPKPSALDHCLLWPSPPFLHPLILDVRPHAALQKQFLSVSFDHFLLSLPGCTVCIILSRFKQGEFSHIKVIGMIDLKVVPQTNAVKGFRFRWQNFLILGRVKQYRSTLCMRMDSELNSDTLAMPNACRAEPGKRPALSQRNARTQPPFGLISASSSAYLPLQI